MPSIKKKSSQNCARVNVELQSKSCDGNDARKSHTLTHTHGFSLIQCLGYCFLFKKDGGLQRSEVLELPYKPVEGSTFRSLASLA